MSSKKVLVLYYSGSGNTKKMAKAIAEAMKSGTINVTMEDAGQFDISSLPNYDRMGYDGVKWGMMGSKLKYTLYSIKGMW